MLANLLIWTGASVDQKLLNFDAASLVRSMMFWVRIRYVSILDRLCRVYKSLDANILCFCRKMILFDDFDICWA